ncbi:pitrilysin family protein [Clostridium sp.]|uniref:M16 family metallopeptidase n=1 Tax=Clostridium sp. TaxID=1506 RepID=UPI002FC61CA2
MKKELFDTEQRKLHNGLTLITVKRDTQIAALHVGVNVGGLHESTKERGISHFIEHMIFKGTINRSNEELNSALENLGGEYNAYTDYTCTVFNTTTLNEELENSVILLADLIQNSNFPDEEVEKERGVILAEIRSSKDDIEDLTFQRVNEIAFDKSHLKWDVIGKESIVKKLTKKQLVEFYSRYYAPNNAIVTIVSTFDHDDVFNMVSRHFGCWKEKKVEKPQVIEEKNKGKLKVTYKKDIEQSTIVYLYSLHGLSKKEELALRILNHKFGESSNSILFRELREERGLAYDVYTMLDLTESIKSLYIYTSVSSENVDEAINVINDCIENMKKEKIVFDDNTINLMKKVFKTAVASTLEDSTDLGSYIIHQAMEDEYIYQFTEDMKNMNHIIGEDLYSVARKVLNNPTIHVMLSEKDEE